MKNRHIIWLVAGRLGVWVTRGSSLVALAYRLSICILRGVVILVLRRWGHPAKPNVKHHLLHSSHSESLSSRLCQISDATGYSRTKVVKLIFLSVIPSSDYLIHDL